MVCQKKGLEGKRGQCGSLEDSGSSVLIISLYQAERIKLRLRAKGSVSLLDVNVNCMNVSSRGSLMVKEEYGIPHEIKVILSKDLGEESLVVGQEHLKTPKILHKGSPRTLSEHRVEIYNSKR